MIANNIPKVLLGPVANQEGFRLSKEVHNIWYMIWYIKAAFCRTFWFTNIQLHIDIQVIYGWLNHYVIGKQECLEWYVTHGNYFL